MTQIERDTRNMKYLATEDMIGKHIYMKRYNAQDQTTIFYIYKINEIVSEYPTRYKTQNCYRLVVPDNRDMKAFVYDDVNDIQLSYTNDILYEMTHDEWLATFRTFVYCDGCQVSQLPTKIIQDEC